ncbi:hypothetical protein Syun_019387 [Stephania yunnanensis]|uniref:Uncharacterized protein n=1 Tax=Stephania yunnanensis TaxID=152371 RepID=A0AAP0IV83_9MAGN
MTKKRLVDYVLTNTYEDLQSFDSDETQPPSEDQRNDNETQDEVENDLYDDVEVRDLIKGLCEKSKDSHALRKSLVCPKAKELWLSLMSMFKQLKDEEVF